MDEEMGCGSAAAVRLFRRDLVPLGTRIWTFMKAGGSFWSRESLREKYLHMYLLRRGLVYVV